MKVCYHYGTEIDPDQRDLKLTPENKALAEKQERKLVSLIKEYYPNLVPVPSLEESCIYSNTPDSDYILDRHPEYQNIIIGAGFSGHGFKCAPVIGRILGDMATGIPPAYDLGAFSMARFRKSNL
uniref:FAD dependent oxidoreductase domain-containing protein n=1 Tax=Ciona savignyi TaxID=51511 RepID=H2YDN6_CIOSA